jgi:hypothetical protein
VRAFASGGGTNSAYSCLASALLTAAVCVGCAEPRSNSSPTPDSIVGDATSCVPGHEACPIDLALALTPGETLRVVQGKLTRSEPSRFYRLCVAEAATLRWQWKGASVHVVLRDTQGNVQGPGLPNPIRLESPGCYQLGLSANTMAEDAFGDFRLTLAISQ